MLFHIFSRFKLLISRNNICKFEPTNTYVFLLITYCFLILYSMLKTIRFSLIIAIILSGSLFYSCHRADDGNKAKYVFYFIGDGMGLQQINTTQAYLAAISDTYGNKDLSFTSFPVTGFATTYAANRYITGSAAAGTALATGSKTSINTLGLNAERTDTLLTVSSIASMVKGAAGQAVQNMNIVFGLPEDAGLGMIPPAF